MVAFPRRIGHHPAPSSKVHSKGELREMRLLTNNGIQPRAVAHTTRDGEPVVQLRCGSLWFELQPGEAADIGRALIKAADESAGRGHTGGL